MIYTKMKRATMSRSRGDRSTSTSSITRIYSTEYTRSIYTRIYSTTCYYLKKKQRERGATSRNKKKKGGERRRG